MIVTLGIVALGIVVVDAAVASIRASRVVPLTLAMGDRFTEIRDRFDAELVEVERLDFADHRLHRVLTNPHPEAPDDRWLLTMSVLDTNLSATDHLAAIGFEQFRRKHGGEPTLDPADALAE